MRKPTIEDAIGQILMDACAEAAKRGPGVVKVQFSFTPGDDPQARVARLLHDAADHLGDAGEWGKEHGEHFIAVMVPYEELTPRMGEEATLGGVYIRY